MIQSEGVGKTEAAAAHVKGDKSSVGKMDGAAAHLMRALSRQLSAGSLRSLSRKFSRQMSLEPRKCNSRFVYGRQSSLDPNRRSSSADVECLSVPENLDSTMQLLFMSSQGDSKGVEEILDRGVDVNSIDLDGRTALHIAACEGHVAVVNLLLTRMANIDTRDRWGSTACADAKHYENTEVYDILIARGAKIPKTRKTPMTVSNPLEIPEYELNPMELQIRKSDGITKGSYQVAKWNGTKVSVKILDKDSYSDPEAINDFKNELTLLEKARHPNVVQFVGAVTQNVPMMIVSEYPPQGDLESYIQKKGRLSMPRVLKFAIHISRGMNYLHDCKPDPIIHCDLKPKNILLDNSGHLKIAGFGVLRFSNVTPEKFKLTSNTLSERFKDIFTAPEIYYNQVFDKSVDVYSFGVILYVMIEGMQPFHPKSGDEALKMMCADKIRPHFKTKSKSIPSDLKELIEECWHEDVMVRPSFSEIIVRLDKMVSYSSSKHGSWKDTFKLPWK